MSAVRSALFLAWFLAITTLLSLIFLPVLVLPRGATVWLARAWSRATFFGLKWLAGLDWEIRGVVPKGPVLVASKHMSMWDTLALYLALNSPAIVLKRSLLTIPFYGWFLWKATAIAIDRGAGAGALRKMSAAAQQVLGEGRPILIFPEGTRVDPGAHPPLQPGVAALASRLGIPVVPVMTNSGLFWGRLSFRKRSGTVRVAIQPPLSATSSRAAVLEALNAAFDPARLVDNSVGEAAVRAAPETSIAR